MVLKLYGHLVSPPVRAVLLLLKNLDIPAEFVELDVAKVEHKGDEYLKINPRGTMPALNDNGLILLDSHAINIYLTTKCPAGEKFYPSDPAQRAAINERLFFEAGELFALAKETVKKILTSGVSSIDEKIAETFESRYASLEIYLKGNKYIAGDSVTIADFSVVPTLTAMNLFVPLKKDKFPFTAAYMDRAATMPYHKEVNEAGLKLNKEYFEAKNITLPLVRETEACTMKK